MFFVHIIGQIGIVFGLIILFLGLTLLNKRIPTPEGVELPEKCSACISTTCIVKREDVKETIKDEIRTELQNKIEECEVENEKK